MRATFKIKHLTLLFLIIGCGLDVATTEIALGFFPDKIYEANPYVQMLMDLGICLQMDLLWLFCLWSMSFCLSRLVAPDVRKYVWLGCWLCGGVRFCAGIHNIFIILQVI